MISTTNARVFRASNGRRYLTLMGACRAETRAIFRRICGKSGEQPEDLFEQYHPKMERVAKMMRARFHRIEHAKAKGV